VVLLSGGRGRSRRLRSVAAVAVLLGLVVVLSGCDRQNVHYDWDWGIVPQYLPRLLDGLKISLEVTGLAAVFGTVLAVPVAFGRLSSSRLVRALFTIYVEVFRGTPALVQLVAFYYILPIATGFQLDGLVSAVIALTLNMGAFAGEAFRSGVQAIPKEQMEAADILGLRGPQKFQHVTLPQAFRIILPVYISYLVALFKDSSLVSVIGVSDLMYTGSTIVSTTYRPMEILPTVAAIYLAVALPFTLLARRLERRLSRHLAMVS
jgi:polar amino acid transport system permease protein